MVDDLWEDEEEVSEKWRFRWDGWDWTWVKNHFYFYRDCPACGKAAIMGMSARTCNACSHKRYKAIQAARMPAAQAVARAIREGNLERLDGSVSCVDCGSPAQVYDHRWYSKPLEVEPVCRSCNSRRGPAFDSPSLRRRNGGK